MSPLCFGVAKVVAFCDVTIQNGLNPSQNLFHPQTGTDWSYEDRLFFFNTDEDGLDGLNGATNNILRLGEQVLRGTALQADA